MAKPGLLLLLLFVGTSTPAAAFSSYVAFGDSITAASWPWPVYARLLADANGWKLSNRAVGGYTACDGSINEVIGGPTPVIKSAGNPIFTVMFGANDALGGLGAYEEIYKGCLAAEIAWLSVPNKVLGPAATDSLGWSPFTFTVNGYQWLAPGTGVVTSTNGSKISFEIAVGPSGVLYAWYGWSANGKAPSGSFIYSVDGGIPATVEPPRFDSHTTPATALAGLQMLRVTGLSPGQHFLQARINGLAPFQALVFFGVGTPPEKPVTKILVGGVMRRQKDALARSTAQYNADAKSVATLLSGDGLPVVFVPVRDYVDDVTDMTDDVHPNAAGQAHLKAAFAAAHEATSQKE